MQVHSNRTLMLRLRWYLDCFVGRNSASVRTPGDRYLQMATKKTLPLLPDFISRYLFPAQWHSKPRLLGFWLQVWPQVVQNVFSLATNWTDKVGFDLDEIGRKRRISQIVEQLTISYGEGKVNIAVWNMHLPEDHGFGGLLSSGTSPMGNGGGFCICVFTGSGWIENNGKCERVTLIAQRALATIHCNLNASRLARVLPVTTAVFQ